MRAVAGRGQRAGDSDGCTAEAVEGAQSWGEPRPGSCGREHQPMHLHTRLHMHPPAHLPMHLHMHPPLHLHTSHGCSRRRFRRCSWPAARGGGVAHVVAGWSTVGPPRELSCAACGKHFGAPSPGTGGPLPTGGGVTKVARSAPRCLPGSHAWVGVRSKSAASVVCVRAACCCSICPSGRRSAEWPPWAAARGAASRARERVGRRGEAEVRQGRQLREAPIKPRRHMASRQRPAPHRPGYLEPSAGRRLLVAAVLSVTAAAACGLPIRAGVTT